MAKEIFLFFKALYKMINLIKLITQLLDHIIKYISLLNLRIENFLLSNRLILLLYGIDS